MITSVKSDTSIGSIWARLALLPVFLLLLSCGGGGGGSATTSTSTPTTDVVEEVFVSSGGDDAKSDAVAAPFVVQEVFVSPGGNDSNSGTMAAPFKTLEQARTAVRAQIARGIPAKGITVWLRGGLYERASTLELTELDSGTVASPVTWRSYGAEVARITGAKLLDPAWFTVVNSNSAVWSRLDVSARGNVLQVDLRAHGVTDYGLLLTRGFGSSQAAALELFINGKAQPLARWPDTDHGVVPFSHGFAPIASRTSTTSFTVSTDRLNRWSTAPDAWVHAYFGFYWADDHLAVQSIDAAQKKISLVSKPSFGITAGQPWYAYNLLEEITQPGEWYLDRSTGMLYLWPLSGLNSSEVQVSILEGPLFSLKGASNIVLQSLRLEATRASLVSITDGSNDLLQQLVLKNAGNIAVEVRGGNNHRIAQSHIVDSGDDGIVIEGGNRQTLVAGAHVVEDSELVGFGRFSNTHHPAILLSGVGHIVRHNLIRDAAYSAILFTGNEHRIEFNEIRNVLNATSDGGAIYTGFDWGARGNVIKNNFIHHINTIFAQGFGVHGIYLDDTVAGVQVEGNVIYAVSGNAIQHGGGRDNGIVNNVMARNGVAFATDTRGHDWWKSGQTDWNVLLTALKALNYQSETWASRYPLCAAIPNGWPGIIANDGDPWLYPGGTVFSRNIGYSNTTWINDLAPTRWFQEVKDNLANQDPHFVDEAGLDLTLKSSSPAFALPGFSSIPFKSIGLRSTALPPVVQ